MTELQLKGKGSSPPEVDVPLAKWLGRTRQRPEVVCVEHRLPIEERDFVPLLEHLRAEIGRGAAG